MEQPLFTIVIAVLNNENTIRRCLSSVIEQSYMKRELLIIDGGSTDGTLEVLKSYDKNIDYWESRPDRGIYHAWNKALEKAKGEWIYFLGADDYLWDKSVLEDYADHLKSVPDDIQIVYGRVCIVDSDGVILRDFGEPWAQAKPKFPNYMSIPHQGVMHHRSLFEQLGPFDESFKIAGDYELLLRVFKNEEAIFIPDLIVAGMEYGGIASNREYVTQRLKEDLRARKKNGFKLISFYWVKGYAAAVLRPLLARLLGENNIRRLAIMRGKIIGRPSHWEKIKD